MNWSQKAALAIRIAAHQTGVPAEQIAGHKRTAELVRARYFAIRLMRNSRMTIPAIAEAVNRDTSTISYALKKTADKSRKYLQNGIGREGRKNG